MATHTLLTHQENEALSHTEKGAESVQIEPSAVEVEAKLEGHQPEQATEKVEILSKELEKPDSLVAGDEAKLVGKSEVIDEVENISTELEKSHSEKPEIEVKPEAPSEVSKQVKNEEVEDSTPLKEEKTYKEEEPSVSITSEQATQKEDEVQSSHPDVTGKVSSKDQKEEPSGVQVVESFSKETVAEMGEEKDAKTTKTEESTQPIKEQPKSELGVKDRESSDKLELSNKDGDGTEASQDLTKEVPAKATQKQSNNIISKVKQSLVKAKKAIIGKSPSSKTLSSQTKGDIKVK